MRDWVFKILRQSEWAACRESVSFEGAPIDVSDGYIHFSTIEQLRETADKHFADEGTIYIAVFSAASWSKSLKWEPSRGGQLFPHLYQPLDMTLSAKNWTLNKTPDNGFDISAIKQWAKSHD